ncbi:MAG: FGGY-family carbohydrate kinase [Candidatus Heimdallarchaeota archaeon]|nr:MAG: FGGY-family carbohydrate kinase [Candidatus Heimdallarchaeota archaeon]
MTDKKFLAYDLGTTATKAVLISNDIQFIDSAVEEYKTYFPQLGYVEHDPKDWWRTIVSTTKTLLEKTSTHPDEIAAVTFCSQMQGLTPVDAQGNPLMNCMIWLDARGAEYLKKLWPWPRVMGYSPYRLFRKFLKITGGAPGLTGKDQIPKILWLKDKHPEMYEKSYKFLDVKDYVIFRLTGEMITSTDFAFVWWLLDTRKKEGMALNQWSKALCKMYKIDMEKLPEVRKPTDIIGSLTSEAANALGLLKETPIVCGVGDLTAAAIGSGAVLNGELHCQIGTSGWVAGHVSDRKVDINHYTGCVGSAFPDQFYLVLAHQEIAGACLEWVKNNIIYYEEELLAKEKKQVYEIFDDLVSSCTPGAKGKGGTYLMFMPWFAGERAPLDDDHVRGGLINLSLDHDRRHLLRAVFEGVALNARWALETVENMYSPVNSLSIIGGGAKSDVWCQIYADVLNRTIRRVKDPQEAGALGAAIVAKMALGELEDVSEIKEFIHFHKEFKPNPEYRELYDSLFKEFQQLYRQNKKWFKRMNAR